MSNLRKFVTALFIFISLSGVFGILAPFNWGPWFFAIGLTGTVVFGWPVWKAVGAEMSHDFWEVVKNLFQ